MSSDLHIDFDCPHCQTLLRAGIKLAGTKGKCPDCGKEIDIPEKDSISINKERESGTN